MAKRIGSVPLHKYRIQGKASVLFNQQWDQVSIGTIASAIGISFKTTNSGKLVCKCIYHEDSTESATIFPPGGGPATFYCSVCGSLTLFEVYGDRRGAENGGEATLLACQDFHISQQFAVVGVKNSSAKEMAGTGDGDGSGKKLTSGYIDPVLSEESLGEMHHTLLDNEDALDFISTEKGWTLGIIKEFKIGFFDRGKNDRRYIVPIRDQSGKLINYRMYNPKKTPKWLGLDGVKADGLFPHDVDPTLGPLLIVEGEGDAVCARAHGINAHTGTAGSGTWRSDWSNQFSGYDVAVMYDNDQAGVSGSILVGESLVVHGAASVKVLKALSQLPKGDICDLFTKEDGTKEQVLKAIEDAPLFENEDSLLESFTEMDYDGLINLKPKSRVKSKFKVNQIGRQAGMVSSRVLVSCQRNTKKACNGCPAADQSQFIVPSTPHNIDFMQTHQISTDHAKLKAMLGLHCSEISPEFDDKYSLYHCSINHPDSPFTESRPIETCMMVSDEHVDIISPTTFDAQIEIGQYPSGRGKNKTWYLFKPTKVPSLEDLFNPTESYELLSQFQANKTYEHYKIMDIYDDIESKLAIQDRLHPIIATDLCFLSVKEIAVKQGMFTKKMKGVLEVAIFGATRTGKTGIATGLRELYRSGNPPYDCANLSNASLIGMVTDGKFGPGILPRSDGDLIILDEADKYPEDSKFAKLTATRSSGIAKYNKLNHNHSLPARVRIVWIANPPHGKEMTSYSFPFEIFRDVMRHESSISRFDFAISLMSKEFTRLMITDKNRYSVEAHRQLVLFSRSIKSEDIVVEDGVFSHINHSTKSLYDRFGKDKGPISNDIEEKLLRISAAIAVRLFNFDIDKHKLIVSEVHAEIAVKFMNDFHSHKDVAYDKMHLREYDLSTKLRDDEKLFEAFEILKEDDDRTLLCLSIEENIGFDEFDKDQLISMFPKSGISNSLDFFEKMINSGAIYNFTSRDERSGNRPKYRISKDGMVYIEVIREVGLSSRDKVRSRVIELRNVAGNPEQQKIPF